MTSAVAGPAILARGFTKMYGRHRGVLDLDLEVRPGEVFGYLGPNGSGKTTTIRLLLGLLRPTRGDAHVFDLDPWTRGVEVHRRVGYLPGELALYEQLTAEELFAHFGHLRGRIDWPFVRRLTERLDLDPTRHIRQLSRGNKQKVGVVQAFLHRPDLLVLDEPTTGLDPLVQEEFQRIIREEAAEGRTVFLSSHVLHEVEHLADRVGIIREGRLVVVEEIGALKAKALHELELHFGGPVPAAAFAALPGVSDVAVADSTLRCTVTGSIDALVKAASRFEVVRLTSHEADLEDIFLAYYGRDEAEGGGRSAG